MRAIDGKLLPCKGKNLGKSVQKAASKFIINGINKQSIPIQTAIEIKP